MIWTKFDAAAQQDLVTMRLGFVLPKNLKMKHKNNTI